MKPVLAHVTLDHEAGHIIRQPAEAIHWHRGHLRPALERSAAGQVRSVKRSSRQQHASFLDDGWAQTTLFNLVNQVPQCTNPSVHEWAVSAAGMQHSWCGCRGQSEKSPPASRISLTNKGRRLTVEDFFVFPYLLRPPES